MHGTARLQREANPRHNATPGGTGGRREDRATKSPGSVHGDVLLTNTQTSGLQAVDAIPLRALGCRVASENRDAPTVLPGDRLRVAGVWDEWRHSLGTVRSTTDCRECRRLGGIGRPSMPAGELLALLGGVGGGVAVGHRAPRGEQC